jgi:hypothetical protein
MPREPPDKEEYDRLIRQFDGILSRDEEFPPREINWGLAWITLKTLRGLVRRMSLTRAERKRLNSNLDGWEGSFSRQSDKAIEDYPIKMESLLERLRSILERVKTKELPARDAWSVVTEVNSFFQNNRIRCPARDRGILRLKIMVRELKAFQRKR